MGYIREVVVNAPVEIVFRAWTSQAEAERWLAPSANVTFAEGGAYEFFWCADPDLDSTRGCRLVAIEPERRLVFEWQGNRNFIDLFRPPNERTLVEARFLPAPEPDRTTVVVEQRETRNLEGWVAYDEWMADAWEEALQGLKRYCENADAAPYWQQRQR